MNPLFHSLADLVDNFHWFVFELNHIWNQEKMGPEPILKLLSLHKFIQLQYILKLVIKYLL